MADDWTDPFGTMARRILQTALREDRAAELLKCLFDGGSATVEATGALVLVSGDALKGIG